MGDKSNFLELIYSYLENSYVFYILHACEGGGWVLIAKACTIDGSWILMANPQRRQEQVYIDRRGLLIHQHEISHRPPVEWLSEMHGLLRPGEFDAREQPASVERLHHHHQGRAWLHPYQVHRRPRKGLDEMEERSEEWGEGRVLRRHPERY